MGSELSNCSQVMYNGTVRGALTVIIVHCCGNHFLKPEKWGSTSGCHGNVLYISLHEINIIGFVFVPLPN